MIKQVLSAFGIFILLGGEPSFQVSANYSSNFKAPELSPNASLSYGDNFTLLGSDTISTKKGSDYDDSKDPALRKGTENWEGPQGSFFVIPAILLGVLVIILFFNRK